MASSETVSPVRAARLARDERLVDVAGAASISVSYLSMIENGLVPPLATKDRIATALEKPATELWAS